LKTMTSPLVERQNPARPAAFFRRGLWLILALMLLAAGCGPVSVAGSWAGVTASDDGLIMAYTDRVTRLNSSGVARWEFPAPGDELRGQTQFYAPPAVTEDVVYVGGYNHKVYALNRDNGQLLWVNEDASSRIIAGLTVAAGKVLVGIGDHGVMALDQRTGQKEWFFDTTQGVWAAPLVVDQAVYVGSLDKHLYALDVATGQELWRQNLGGAIAGTPAYAEGVLYVGTFVRTVVAVNADDGAVLNTFHAENWVWDTPTVADGMLYVGDMSGNVYALQARTFTPVWQRKVAREGIRTSPLVVGDLLIIGSRDDTVYAVDRATGMPVWQQPVGGDVLSNLTLLNDELVVISTMAQDRQLVAFDLDGQTAWTYPPVAASQ